MTETEIENCAVTYDVEGRRTFDSSCRGCCSSRWVDIVEAATILTWRIDKDFLDCGALRRARRGPRGRSGSPPRVTVEYVEYVSRETAKRSPSEIAHRCPVRSSLTVQDRTHERHCRKRSAAE